MLMSSFCLNCQMEDQGKRQMQALSPLPMTLLMLSASSSPSTMLEEEFLYLHKCVWPMPSPYSSFHSTCWCACWFCRCSWCESLILDEVGMLTCQLVEEVVHWVLSWHTCMLGLFLQHVWFSIWEVGWGVGFFHRFISFSTYLSYVSRLANLSLISSGLKWCYVKLI